MSLASNRAIEFCSACIHFLADADDKITPPWPSHSLSVAQGVSVCGRVHTFQLDLHSSKFARANTVHKRVSSAQRSRAFRSETRLVLRADNTHLCYSAEYSKLQFAIVSIQHNKNRCHNFRHVVFLRSSRFVNHCFDVIWVRNFSLNKGQIITIPQICLA